MQHSMNGRKTYGKQLDISVRLRSVLVVVVVIIALQAFVGPWPPFQFLDPIHSR
jgi:hypothetical protein